MINPKAINPMLLPSVALHAKTQLPECPAVYFVIHGNTVLYIGKAINLFSRWKGHHRFYEINKTYPSARLAWMEVGDRGLLLEVETALIEWFKPSLNGRLVEYGGSKKPQVVVYLSVELKADLEALAEKENRSVSHLLETVAK